MGCCVVLTPVGGASFLLKPPSRVCELCFVAGMERKMEGGGGGVGGGGVDAGLDESCTKSDTDSHSAEGLNALRGSWGGRAAAVIWLS